ncbi:hypothetical protein HOF65_00350 [bacterium]|nr:hypothetical protein [bacterium]MBT3852500.1 hypothetical protein [bacterium]MBT4632667.1 hypothetical protein [bacterium]MBT6778315.1 hypothetical protein [bacterium]
MIQLKNIRYYRSICLARYFLTHLLVIIQIGLLSASTTGILVCLHSVTVIHACKTVEVSSITFGFSNIKESASLSKLSFIKLLNTFSVVKSATDISLSQTYSGTIAFNRVTISIDQINFQSESTTNAQFTSSSVMTFITHFNVRSCLTITAFFVISLIFIFINIKN